MAASNGHEIVAVTAFELIGVSLLAIIADLNKALGNVVVMLMVSFLFFWFIAHGAGMLSKSVSNVGKLA